MASILLTEVLIPTGKVLGAAFATVIAARLAQRAHYLRRLRARRHRIRAM